MLHLTAAASAARRSKGERIGRLFSTPSRSDKKYDKLYSVYFLFTRVYDRKAPWKPPANKRTPHRESAGRDQRTTKNWALPFGRIGRFRAGRRLGVGVGLGELAGPLLGRTPAVAPITH